MTKTSSNTLRGTWHRPTAASCTHLIQFQNGVRWRETRGRGGEEAAEAHEALNPGDSTEAPREPSQSPFSSRRRSEESTPQSSHRNSSWDQEWISGSYNYYNNSSSPSNSNGAFSFKQPESGNSWNSLRSSPKARKTNHPRLWTKALGPKPRQGCGDKGGWGTGCSEAESWEHPSQSTLHCPVHSKK